MTLLLSWLLATSVAAAPQQSAAPASAPASTPPATQQNPPDAGASERTGELPVSLDHIRDALSRPPAIRLEDSRPVFRVEVIGRKLTIEDILGPDYLKGPTPVSGGGPTHQEILDLVTPKDVQGYAAFSNKEAAVVAATSFGFALALEGLQKAIHKFQEAKADRDREAARQEVQNALAELEKARAKAGLPPK